MPTNAMPLVAALEALAAVRRDEVVITTMAAAREWPKISSHPLDFHYVPSSMGQAPGIGLGMALARPERRVIVLNGDGCMLMNLGALVTTAALAPPNYVLIVLDNGVYEVTGGQPTAAKAAAAAGRPVDFAALARAAGFSRAYRFGRLADWQAGAAEAICGNGPVFIALDVEPVPGGVVPRSPAPPRQRVAELRERLCG